MKRFAIAMCLVLAVVGCGKSGGGGGDPKNMTPEQACDKAISMMNDMGKAVQGAGEDCDKMGAALEKWANDNKAFIEWGKEQDKDEAKKKKFDEVCKPKMEKATESMMAMMGGLMKCGENPKVKAAMEKMD